MNWHRLGSIIILLFLMCFTASAQDYPEIVFIFDASGSMSESAGGETKITVAKNVMKQIVPELDSNIRAGLIAYGHRRKGDCLDHCLVTVCSAQARTCWCALSAVPNKGRAIK